MTLLDGVTPTTPLDVDGTLYFVANNGGRSGLWKTDGTPGGTVFLKALLNPENLTRMGGAVYFYAGDAATGFELWKSDGTPAGTVLVKDIRPGPANSYPSFTGAAIFDAGGTLYFHADDGIHGAEIWKTDGTANGTVMLKDINPGSANGVVSDGITSDTFGEFGVINGRVVFPAAQGPANTQGTNALWSTDGTDAGTVKINDRDGRGFVPYGFTPALGTLFFGAWNGTGGYDLWRTDGTAAGTALLKTITPARQSAAASVAHLIQLNGKVYFTAGQDSTGRLWSSDGTADGTVVVDDSVVPLTVDLGGVTAVDGTLFFAGHDRAGGNELWMVPSPVVPAQPGPPSVTVITGTEVRLDWADLSGNESGFRIERSTDPAFANIQMTAMVLGGITSFEDSGLSPNTTYHWRVSAYNSGGASPPATATARTSNVPTRPTSFAATPVAATTIRLSWADRSANENGFRIERSTSPEFTVIDKTYTAPVDAIQFDDTEATNAVTYHYRLRTFNAAGASPDRVASATTPLLPTAPSDFSATVASGGEIDLAWDDNSGNETGFKLERSTSAAFATVERTFNLPPDMRLFTDEGLSRNTIYYYRLRAVNSVSESAPVTASAATFNSPHAPTGLTAAAYSGTRVDLAWTDVADTEDGYRVERSLSPTFATIDAAFTLPVNATTYSDTTAAPLTTYHYRVYAYNVGGNSGRPSKSVTTPDRPPGNVVAYGVGGDRIELRWTDSSSTEQSFRVERATGSGLFSLVRSLPAGTTSYTDIGLASLSSFTYRVVAVGPNGAASPSEPATAVTLAPQFATPLADIVPGTQGSDPSWLAEMGGRVYFSARHPEGGSALYRADLTGGVSVVRRGDASGLTAVNGALYFRGSDPSTGMELWMSDGTPAGTALVADLTPGPADTVIDTLTAAGSTLFFTVSTGDNTGFLWKTDGTAGGTLRLSDTVVDFSNPSGLTPALPVAIGGSLYFRDRPGALYRSDGTVTGTARIEGHPFSQAFGMTAVGGTLFFAARSASEGWALWKTDGTTAGTMLVKDVHDGVNFPPLGELTNANGTLFFWSDDPAASVELWKSDGTTAGTAMVKDIIPGPIASFPKNLTAVGGSVYMFAWGPASNSHGLWKSDGTAAGTVRSRETSAPGAGPAPVMTGVGGKLFYTDDGALWRSDGTDTGTVQVMRSFIDAVPPGASWAVAGDRLVLRGYDPTRGKELWSVSATPPAAPGSLGVTAVPGSVTLNWVDHASDESGFVIERSNRGDFGGINARFFTPARSTQFIDTTATGEDVYHYRVRAVNAGGDSGYSNTAAFASGAPRVVSAEFLYHTYASPRLVLRFNRDVGDTLSAADVSVRPASGGTAVSPASVAYDPLTYTVTFTFSAALSNGDYVATLPRTAVADALGNGLAADYSAGFFALAGDLNRDRSVNGTDFALLAANFGKTGRTYAQGDVTGDGLVNGSDFAILAANFGRSLGPPPASLAADAGGAAQTQPAAQSPAAVSVPAPLSAPAPARRKAASAKRRPALPRRPLLRNRSLAARRRPPEVEPVDQ